MRHSTKGAGAVMGRARAPAAMATVVGLEHRSGIRAFAGKAKRRKSPEMSPGYTLRERRLQRSNDTVDDGGKRNAIQSHCCCWFGADQLALGQNHFERPESSLVGRLLRRNQILERHSRGGASAAVIARIDAAAHLG